MIRSGALVPLSREHHEALVLARRACDPARPGAAPGALREQLLERWPLLFEPHFRAEEEVLLASLRDAGAAALADAAQEQHEHLRALVERLRAGELSALPAWGEAMRLHVRWEERELFPQAEALLDLSRLAEALQRRTEVLQP